jgi:hypothetical protein
MKRRLAFRNFDSSFVHKCDFHVYFIDIIIYLFGGR